MAEPLAYLNGRLISAAEAALPVYDAGVALGAAVTEISRTFHRRPYRLADHLARLFRSLSLARLEIGLTREALTAVTLELVDRNARLLGEGEELGINHFVTAGAVPGYARMTGRPPQSTPTVGIVTFPLDFNLYAVRARHGVRLVTPSVRQIPPACLDPHLKCRSRMHYYLADQEARRTDAEALALLLDLDGNVTEASAANFLMVEQGAIISPPPSVILQGISRQTVIELAAGLNIPFAERVVPLADALRAEEAFLTSTPYCLLPVSHVNGLAVGDGRPGPVFRRLRDAWSREVEIDIGRQIEGQNRQ